jgi:transposase InsO family protein
LHPIDKGNEPWTHLHADIAGPLPITSSGHRFLLVIVDSFSKYLIVAAMKDSTAATVAGVLVAQVFNKWGVPKRVTTDQGRQFVGHVFEELAQLCGFEHNTSSPAHQAANGQAERFVGQVKDM